MRAFLGTHLVRTVAQYLPQCHVRHRIPGQAQAAALTFEDGPYPQSTPELLDVLDEFGVSATFFLIGEQAAQHPELVREIARRGHTLGNHTYHHADAWRISTLRAIRDIRSCSRLIDGVSGQLPVWWRPPYGHLTNRLVDWCHRHSLQTALWDVLAPDASKRGSARRIERSIERHLRPGSIVSLQDQPESVERTVEALHNTLPKLQHRGWKFHRLESQPIIAVH